MEQVPSDGDAATDPPIVPAAARLIIVDQGLRELAGHHAEYTLSVAACAARRMPVIILAHARCAVSAPTGVQILPTFRFEWTQAQRASATVDYDPAVSFTSYLFLADLRAGLARAGAGCDDQVFIHTIGFDEIADLFTLAMTVDRRQLPALHVLLRRDLDEIGDKAGRRDRFVAYVRAFAAIGLWPDRVRFYCDTDELSDHYASVTGVPFCTVPIPFNELAAIGALRAPRQMGPERPVIVGYLGDARVEKGYQFLPAAAEALQEYLAAGKARLRLQSNFHFASGKAGMADSRRRLEALGAGAVELIYRTLSQQEYYRQLAEMDVVLLPYVADRYRRRSSGIFAQAVAAGKIVVVPRGTTMWTAAERLGIESCIPFTSASDLPKAVADAIDRCASLREAAAAAAERWLAAQPTMTLLGSLLGRPSLPGKKPAEFAGPLVLHILDGPNTFGQRERAQRSALRSGVFQRRGCRILTIMTLPLCPSRAELTAWLVRNYQHWFSTGAGFSWLLYFTQAAPESPVGLAAEIRNAELFSMPETLPATIGGAAIDVVWVDSLASLCLVDLLRLPGRVPIIFECDELKSLRYALHRAEPVHADELIRELSMLNRTNLALLAAARLRLYLPDRRHGGHCLAAFRSPRDGAAAADICFVIAGDDRGELCRWFLECLYVRYLLPRRMTVALAGSAADSRYRPDFASRFPNIVWLDNPIVLPQQAYDAARIVLLPIAAGADLDTERGERLAALAADLPSLVRLAASAEEFAAQLDDLRAAALPSAPTTPGHEGYLSDQAVDYVGAVTRQLAAIGRNDAG